MIEKYIIKNENNEEILYLYLNYNYEFGSFNKGKPFLSELKKILNNNIINFKGNKIILIAGSLIIGTIFLNNTDYKKYNNLDNNKYISQIILNDFNNEDKVEIDINKDINSNINENIDNKENNINDNINNKENIDINKNDNVDNNQEIPETIINNNEIINDNNINNEIITNIANENTNNNQTIITVYRSNGEILNIELEEYLIGVVAGEMPASFHMEALKVQAIIARTYALKSIENNKILTDNTSTQVYIDKSQMYYKWGSDFNKYYYKIKEAVNNTEGMVITYNNELIDAVYFANSNGFTEDSKEVWGYDIPYLKSVESPFDVNTTRYKKVITKSFEEVKNILCIDTQNIEIYNIIKNNSNRVSSITINNKTYTGIEIRTLFNLNSTDFEIEITDNSLIFTTYGYGHGVGVSQYGANGMANNGYNYEDIIKYYYKDINIKKI